MSAPELPERVWLLRHAETATPAIFHGAESDVGLSELGKRQATAAAAWFRELRPSVVVSSRMRRAVDTAAPIAEACGVAHHFEEQLHERRVGDLSGTPFAQSEGPWAETLRHWTAGNAAYTTPGAESFEEMQARLQPAWDRVVKAHPGERLVVVAHGVVCKVLLLSLLEGWDVSGWVKLGRVANVAVTELVPNRTGWNAGLLLTVPDPVSRLSEGQPTGVGVGMMKSEA